MQRIKTVIGLDFVTYYSLLEEKGLKEPTSPRYKAAFDDVICNLTREKWDIILEEIYDINKDRVKELMEEIGWTDCLDFFVTNLMGEKSFMVMLDAEQPASNAFGERLKNLRKQNNMTQADVANAIGTSVATVCKWESGTTVPRLPKLNQLAEIYHVDIWTLMGKRSE